MGKVLLATHPAWCDHDTGPHHPERPARLDAVAHGTDAAGEVVELEVFSPSPAPRAALEQVHTPGYLDALQAFCDAGGGSLDPDTSAGPPSWGAALLAAGAGLDAAERLVAGDAAAAFCAVRPPGHHALPTRAMGFCLVNNVAVTAAVLADRGERVAIVDYDAHHGNGTEAMFWRSAGVLYVSMHEYPMYPGTGALDDVGEGEGFGTTLNLPFPAGTTGDAYRAALDEVVEPALAAFEPGWVLLSAGFDAHRRDPLTGLALTAGDYADLTARLVSMAPPGRCIAFLEGGYDLEAVAASTAATVAALGGEALRPEASSTGATGRAVVDAAARLRAQLPS